MYPVGMIRTIVLLSLLATVADETPFKASETAVLSTLRSGHPRLIVLDDELARVRQLIRDDPAVGKVYDDLRKSAEKMLDEPTVVYKLVGPRLLTQSRRCLQRVYTLGTMYRLEQDRRFALRAEKEMLAAAAFPDWNPRHFLDTAEMCHALGVGYDWLYDVLSPESRSAIRAALVEKGLEPGRGGYRRKVWWTRTGCNWNQVCNGGLTIGALAIADEEPELAAAIVSNAAELIRIPTARLAPDGGWDEGPGYWNYAMRYTAYYLAAIQTALGTDFGISKSPGLAETGLFRIYAIGPTKLAFNFADAETAASDAPQMFLFARLFDRPVYAWHQRRFGTGTASTSALNLLWYDGRGTDADAAALPLDAYFKNIDVVFFRSAWNDDNALFVGFKGGNNRANHSHPDLGTFVLDALGRRWAIDLGRDYYNIPGYFSPEKRWTYYRLRTEGHNTLVIDGENQDLKAAAPIISYGSTPARAFAVADLSAGYAPRARRVQRGVAMLDRKRVLVQDEIEVDAPLNIEWTMHTTANVKIDGPLATLSLDGRQLRVRAALAAAGAAWQVRPVNLEPPQLPTKNVRKLVLRVKATPPRTRFAVLLAPVLAGEGGVAQIDLLPLADWPRAWLAEHRK